MKNQTIEIIRSSQRSEGMVDFQGVKVFSATKAKERGELGDVMTSWMQNNPDYHIKDVVVRQSSDNEFHCLSLVVFYDVE